MNTLNTFRSFILVPLLFLSIMSHSQRAKFDLFTFEDGLIGNNILDIAQDSSGFIWVQTEQYLHRFDGEHFLGYPENKNEIFKTNEPSEIHVLSDTKLYLIYESKKITLNTKTGKLDTILLDDILQNDCSIVESKSNSNGVIVLMLMDDKEENTFFWKIQNDHLTKLPVKNLRIMDFCLSNSNLIYAYNKSTNKVQEINFEGTVLQEFPIVGDKLHFKISPNGDLYAFDQNLIKVKKSGSNTFSPHPSSRFINKDWEVKDIEIEPNGNCWISCGDRRILYYDSKVDDIYNYQSHVFDITSTQNALGKFFRDNSGILWVGSQFGLLKITPPTSYFDTYLSQIDESCQCYNSLRGITGDDQGIIILENGQKVLDPQKKTFLSPLPKYPHQSFGIHFYDNKLWLNRGIYIDLETGKIKQVENNPHHFQGEGYYTTDKYNNLWLGYGKEIYLLEKNEENYKWQSNDYPDLGYIEAMHSGQKSGLLWIGTREGIFSFNLENQKFIHIDNSKFDLIFNRILTLHEDNSGNLWMGTNAGLISYNPTSNTIKIFRVEDGLSNSFISSLLSEGDSCLWLGTNHGLSRFSIKEESFLNFYEEDGLTHNEFNRTSYYKASDGRMFFGGLAGLNVFYPEEVMDQYWKNKTEPKTSVSLTSFSRTDLQKDSIIQDFWFGDVPVFDIYHWNKSFIFEFSLSDYWEPKGIQYSYKMEGYENLWSKPSTSNEAHFNLLSSGTYQFQVKARDNKGIWNPNILTAKVIVHPPWWATIWAYCSYALLFLGGLYLIYWFLSRRLILQNQLELRQAEMLRLKELDSFKSKLYTNLTHEFRTPLTIILGMSEQIKENPKRFLDDGLAMINRNGESLLRLINQLLDLSKLENDSFKINRQQGNIIPYLNYLVEAFQTYVNRQNLSLKFISTLEELEMAYDPNQIQQIITNLMSNAAKFTPSGGQIEVKVFKQDENLRIDFSDTGIGISDSALPYIFDRFYQVDNSSTRQAGGTGIGLAHTRELIKLMDGDISVNSQEGRGTTFIVTLPIILSDFFPKEMNLDNKLGQNKIEDSWINLTPIIIQEHEYNQDLPHLLIIEDNHDVVAYLKICLSEYYNLDVAYNGKIGIEKALSNVPDLIISDIMMPEKDGYEVCDFLKNNECTSHIPIVLLTAKSDAASKIAGPQTRCRCLPF